MSVAVSSPPVRPEEDGYIEAFGAAWSTGNPADVLPYFAPDGMYGDVGNRTEWRGHDKIAQFYEHMLVFAPDTVVEYPRFVLGDGGWWSEWLWSGTASGRLMLDGEPQPRSTNRFALRGVGVATTDEHGRLITYEDFYDMRALLRDLELLDA